MTHASVDLQMVSASVPSVPCWFGEIAIMARLLATSGVLLAIEQRVRFTRPRFGIYEVIDFFAVLIGYAVSGEPPLQAFYERLTPFATTFMALFGRQALPHRSTLCRFLAALDQPAVEALRLLFEEDLVLRTAQTFPPGGLWDRVGQQWQVMDVDGTKQAARQRALPSLPELPVPHRRFDRVCAPAYLSPGTLLLHIRHILIRVYISLPPFSCAWFFAFLHCLSAVISLRITWTRRRLVNDLKLMYPKVYTSLQKAQSQKRFL